MGKGSELATIPTTALDFPSGGKGKRRKGKKNKGGREEGIFAEEVNEMAYEAIGTVAIEKVYFSGKMAEIDKDEKIENKDIAKRDYCVKALLGTIVARRMLKRGGMLAIAARSAAAVAAVNLGRVI